MLITHPRVSLLLPAVTLYTELRAGRFGAIVNKDVCGPFLREDVPAARVAQQMDALAAESDFEFSGLTFAAEMVGTDVLLIEASRRDVAEMAEVYSRVLSGQWSAVVSSLQMSGLGHGYRVGDALLAMRTRYCSGYPADPRASIGAAESTAAGQLGYLTWKMLGGGVPDYAPTFSLDGCWPTIRQTNPV